ncbi:hypothetical protein F66182_6405 [Fusarium sp. NRRL 66182]|nr:hypothetical protein F66182_6405 [Fusarium sp. NRRL 66182]
MTVTETAVESPAEAIVISSASAEPVVADISTPVTEEAKEKSLTNTSASASTSITASSNPQSPLARLLRSPSAIDDFVLHLNRVIKTRGGTDTVLLFTCYAARLVGAILAILGRVALRHSARNVVAMAFKLPPSASVDLSSVIAPRLATLALGLSKYIQGFTDFMGEWRTMNRLWGAVGTYLEARDLVLRLRGQKRDESGQKVPPPDKINTAILIAQILCNTGYHVGEAACWFTCKGATNLSQRVGNKLGIWGARGWSAWVALELFRLLVERARRTPSGDAAAEEEWKTNWKADFIGTLPWMPLSAHWGAENGLMPEMAVAALATWPSYNLMKNAWRATA